MKIYAAPIFHPGLYSASNEHIVVGIVWAFTYSRIYVKITEVKDFEDFELKKSGTNFEPTNVSGDVLAVCKRIPFLFHTQI